MWKALKYILIYFAFQVLAVLIVMVPGHFMDANEPEMLVMALSLASILFCWYIFRKRVVRFDKETFTVRPWTILLLSAIAVFFFLLPEIDLIERLDIPDDIGDELDEIAGTAMGLVTIGILGPLGEELLFRGAVLRSLLEWRPIRSMPWIAIVLSAALFSLVHLNPAQMPGSFMMGLLFGWLAYRTGSLLPGIVGHMFNNSLACIVEMLPAYDGGAETVAEMFDSPALEFLAVGASVFVCAAVVSALARKVKKGYPRRTLDTLTDDVYQQ